MPYAVVIEPKVAWQFSFFLLLNFVKRRVKSPTVG